MEEIVHFMHLVSFAIGLLGCIVLVYGVAIAAIQVFRAERMFWAGQDPEGERRILRHQLGYYLLLSLEILIAADIIDTIVQPSLEEIAILGGILAIRTVISFSLSWEMKSE
jgi:uncharacterized membrane protein